MAEMPGYDETQCLIAAGCMEPSARLPSASLGCPIQVTSRAFAYTGTMMLRSDGSWSVV